VSPGDLTLLAAGIPAGLAAAWLIPWLRGAAVALAPLAPAPALVLAGLGHDTAVEIPGLFTGVVVGVDGVGRAFLFFTSALWLAAGAFGRWYLAEDPRRDSYFGFHLATLSGQITLVMALDILTFYLGFAVMTFAGYGLIVHSGSDLARQAGRTYLAMAVGGEALLLSALLMIGSVGPGWSVEAVPAAYAALSNPGLVAALVAAGFSIKAGLVPLHLWLPLAHPVAPTPASALLSGAMIKAGLLGWIRFLPLGDLAFPATGTVLIALGVAAAFYGVVAGLAQREAKTVLAYSSVSQMGYMATGVGIAMAAAGHAPAAVLAVSHYAGHHAAAKAALFLAVAVAPVALVGGPGSRRRVPRLLFFAGVAAPALALAGAPFTSGSAAKSALKHAGEALPGEWAATLGLLLTVAAVGTTLLLARFVVVLAHGDDGAHAPRSPSARLGMCVTWAGLVALSLGAPRWLPWIFPPPPGVDEPFPVLGIFDSLWPVAIGAVLATAVWRLEHRWPLRPGRIPPGDLLVPLLRLARAAGRRLARLNRSLPPLSRLAWKRLAPGLARLGGAASTVEPRLASGPPLGLLLFLLFALIVAALLAPA
jgi:formate hydrogenlyase subunit 3/multisubunit Na+/H+ antiporter MnhD subunit